MLRRFLAPALLTLVLAGIGSLETMPSPVLADDSFSGLQGETVGEGEIDGINTGGGTDIAQAAEDLLRQVLLLMGIAAVFVIVLVGIGLIVGFGAEESRTRAIKVILYTAAGIIVIGLASALVNFAAKALF